MVTKTDGIETQKDYFSKVGLKDRTLRGQEKKKERKKDMNESIIRRWAISPPGLVTHFSLRKKKKHNLVFVVGCKYSVFACF